MKHARTDYDRIQDPAGIIPENEPVLLLRGQDKLAPRMLSIYAALAAEAGADPHLVEAVELHKVRMEDWQRDEKVKTPDMPADAVLQD